MPKRLQGLIIKLRVMVEKNLILLKSMVRLQVVLICDSIHGAAEHRRHSLISCIHQLYFYSLLS